MNNLNQPLEVVNGDCGFTSYEETVKYMKYKPSINCSNCEYSIFTASKMFGCENRVRQYLYDDNRDRYIACRFDADNNKIKWVNMSKCPVCKHYKKGDI